MFDINAPIERQFTRDGRKVTFVVKCEEAPDYPVAAHIEGERAIYVFTEDGKLYHAWENNYDLVTRPEVVADIVWFANIYAHGTGASYETLYQAIENGSVSSYGVVEFHFNPATLETSSKVVWTPEGGAK